MSPTSLFSDDRFTAGREEHVSHSGKGAIRTHRREGLSSAAFPFAYLAFKRRHGVPTRDYLLDSRGVQSHYTMTPSTGGRIRSLHCPRSKRGDSCQLVYAGLKGFRVRGSEFSKSLFLLNPEP